MNLKRLFLCCFFCTVNLHHVFTADIEQCEDSKYQNRPFFPTAHADLVTKRTDKNQHLQSVHNEQKCRHNIKCNRRFTGEWHENIQ